LAEPKFSQETYTAILSTTQRLICRPPKNCAAEGVFWYCRRTVTKNGCPRSTMVLLALQRDSWARPAHSSSSPVLPLPSSPPRLDLVSTRAILSALCKRAYKIAQVERKSKQCCHPAAPWRKRKQFRRRDDRSKSTQTFSCGRETQHDYPSPVASRPAAPNKSSSTRQPSLFVRFSHFNRPSAACARLSPWN
jgi:hypothetical protein